MINFRQELEKFNINSIDSDFIDYNNETAQIVGAFNLNLKRISKELNNSNIPLEDILTDFVEEGDKGKDIEELRKTLNTYKEEKLSLVESMVTILDNFEDIYRYSLKNKDDNWCEQVQLLWKNILATLQVQGIIRIEGEGYPFDAQVHSAAQVINNENISNGIIVEVLRCGYIYQSKLLRKAKVVVNKTGEGTDNY